MMASMMRVVRATKELKLVIFVLSSFEMDIHTLFNILTLHGFCKVLAVLCWFETFLGDFY